jgi:hypothetical protein
MKALLNKKNLHLAVGFALGSAFCAGLIVVVGGRAAKKVVEIAPGEVAGVLESVSEVLLKTGKRTAKTAATITNA